MKRLHDLHRILENAYEFKIDNIEVKLTDRGGGPTLEFEKAGIYDLVEVALVGKKVWIGNDEQIPEYISQLEQETRSSDTYIPTEDNILILYSQISKEDIEHPTDHIGIASGLRIREAKMVGGDMTLQMEYIPGYSLGKEGEQILAHLKQMQKSTGE